MSLSMVFGIPATATLRPRLLISCKIEELKTFEREKKGRILSSFNGQINILVKILLLTNFPSF